MGFLKKLFRGHSASVQQLPSGTIAVDREGEIISSTVATAYPRKMLRDIAADVLKLFREAREAQMPLTEIRLHLGSLDIAARELRGGAVIFLSPQTALLPTPASSRS